MARPLPPVRPPRRARAVFALASAVVVVGLGVATTACDLTDEAAPPVAETTTIVSTTLPETTTTTAAPAPAPEPPPAPAEPTPADIASLQWTLGTMGYRVDDDPAGEYGSGTRNAVMAFQKLHGLERDGVAGPLTMEAIAIATPVEPRNGRHPHIEVDLAAQVAVVVDGSGGVTVLNATTGASSTPTPPGTFEVFRQVDGWDPGPYGALYRPKYFVGGVAFHGGVPILARPASHGCVRLPDPAVDWLWSSGLADRGTVVDVY